MARGRLSPAQRYTAPNQQPQQEGRSGGPPQRSVRQPTAGRQQVLAAIEAGNAVAEVIAEYYGAETPWIKQCRDGVVAFVERCVHQLGGSAGPQVNAAPLSDGSGYVLPARTADEIKATPAADERGVSRAPRKFTNNDSVDTVARRGELADPVQQQPLPPQPPPRRIILPSDPWNA